MIKYRPINYFNSLNKDELTSKYGLEMSQDIRALRDGELCESDTFDFKKHMKNWKDNITYGAVDALVAMGIYNLLKSMGFQVIVRYYPAFIWFYEDDNGKLQKKSGAHSKRTLKFNQIYSHFDKYSRDYQISFYNATLAKGINNEDYSLEWVLKVRYSVLTLDIV